MKIGDERAELIDVLGTYTLEPSFIGEGLIEYVGEPIFENLWAPLMMKLLSLMGSEGFFHNLVIGQLIDGEIDFGQSFGLLTAGLFVPLAAKIWMRIKWFIKEAIPFVLLGVFIVNLLYHLE
jgi:hypothetical protein